MSQEFHGNVGQVSAGDIKNYGVSINLTETPERRSLVPAQRTELHELRAKCEALGDDPRDVWRRVHAQLGVTSISEICADKFPEARDVIRARLEHLQEEDDKHRLVARVQQVEAEKDARQDVSNFCELAFGRTELNNLKRSELQKVLEFIQRYEPLVIPAHTATAARLPMRAFLITYKWHAAGLFLLGLLVGGRWF